MGQMTASICGGIYARVYCILYCVYDVYVGKTIESDRQFQSSTFGQNQCTLQRGLSAIAELLVITALHEMQTRSSEDNYVRPSVRLSVRLSVRRVICDKMEERSVQIFIPYERTFRLVFWEKEWLVADDPIYVKFWVNQPPLERNRRF